MTSTTIEPELLSPAGDWEALRAAVANGANAVYFGLAQFNARARAANFEVEELPQIMEFLHRRNVRGFVTLNVLIFPDELPAISKMIVAIAEAGVDAVIVQDLGLVRLIHQLAPTLPIHASTQMTLTEPRGIEFVRKLGVERVVLARELSLVDIQKITQQSTMPVEVFVHGALCVAYSGQCLTSEALGGRSANRGQCAQACRLPYEMIVDGEPRDLGDRAYLLSPNDLAAYDWIQPLIEAGVISFKIEGRLKGGPYVAAATQTYRQAIDAAVEKRELNLKRQEELDLAQTFSRGFVPGFLEGTNHQQLVRGRFPKSRGVKLGTVVGITNRGVRVELAESVPEFIKPGDGVLFDLGTPDVQEPAGRVWAVYGVGSIVELRFSEENTSWRTLPTGCVVWKTDDPALRKRLEQSYSQDKPPRRVTIQAMLSGAIDSPLSLSFRDGFGRHATATWTGPIARATKRTTTAEELRDQLDRLGDTPFQLGEVQIDLPVDAMIPRSVLNDLRRQASTSLMQQLDTAKKHEIRDAQALQTLRTAIPKEPKAETAPVLTVLARSIEQLQAVVNWNPPEGQSRPTMVYCDFEDPRRYDDAVKLARDANIPIGLATIRIMKPGEEGLNGVIARAEPDAVLVRNWASLDYFREALPQAERIGDFSLNIANELTADWLRREGLQRLVPSFDLNWEQLASLVRNSTPNWYEVVVHQHMPMFHMEHCVFAAFLSTGKDFRDCGRPCDTHKIELRDRVGSQFPVIPDTGCRNTVFNSMAQSAAEYIERMLALGLRRYRIDLLRETTEPIGQLLTSYANLIAGKIPGPETWRKLKVVQQLGVTRGTLQMV